MVTRSSIREQRQANAGGRGPRLVWLADEAVCAVPEVAKAWPRPAVGAPFYAADSADGDRLDIQLNERPATLLRFRTPDALGRLWAAVRGKAWRSPAAKLSRLFFHLQKAGVPTPPLLAFGQRLGWLRPAESFLASGAGGTPLADHAADRERLLTQLGGVVRAAHDADCTLGAAPVRVVAAGNRSRVTVDPTHGAALGRPLSARQRARDLAAVLRGVGPVSADDGRRVLAGYAADSPTFERRVLRRLGVPA